MDKELLRVIIQELFSAAIEFAEGKKFLTLALKLCQGILLREAVLDRIVASLFGVGVNFKTFAAVATSNGVDLAALNVVQSNEPELSASEMEAKLTETTAA